MTIINRFQGDPKLILGPDGSSLVYKGGQPVMDQGIENAIMIPLFTKKKGKSINQKGWWMNLLWSNPVNQSGSDYVETVINQPLTLNGLANIEKAAAKALTNPLFGNVNSEVTNPEANRIDNKITVSSPGKDVDFLAVSENSENWRAQAFAPANENI